MWNRATAWCLAMTMSGCLRDPDPGGQEGEEIRLGNMEDGEPTAELDTGASTDDGEGTDGSTDSGSDSGMDGGGDESGDTEAPDPSGWTGWLGTFRIERGSSTVPEERDCVLVFDMQGTRTDSCTDCVASFAVRHELVPDSSSGQDVCVDVPATFVRDYVVRTTGDGRFELYVGGPDADPVFYDVVDVVEDALSWSVGSTAIPSTSGSGETVYRTDVESGTASLN